MELYDSPQLLIAVFEHLFTRGALAPECRRSRRRDRAEFREVVLTTPDTADAFSVLFRYEDHTGGHFPVRLGAFFRLFFVFSGDSDVFRGR